jgi:hypothetical protein
MLFVSFAIDLLLLVAFSLCKIAPKKAILWVFLVVPPSADLGFTAAPVRPGNFLVAGDTEKHVESAK